MLFELQGRLLLQQTAAACVHVWARCVHPLDSFCCLASLRPTHRHTGPLNFLRPTTPQRALVSPVQSRLQLSDDGLLQLHRAFKRYLRQGARIAQERQQLQQQLAELLQVWLESAFQGCLGPCFGFFSFSSVACAVRSAKCGTGWHAGLGPD